MFDCHYDTMKCDGNTINHGDKSWGIKQSISLFNEISNSIYFSKQHV